MTKTSVAKIFYHARFALALGLMMTSGMAQASEDKLKLQYDFTGGGVRVLTATFTLTYDQKNYLIKSSWKTRGVASLFAKTVSYLGSRGIFTKNKMQPVEFQSRVENSKGKKSTHIVWQDKNQQKIDVSPALSSYKKASIDKALKPTFPDPLSALFTISFSTENLCRNKIRSFDGRKIFDFNLKYLGQETLKKGDSGSYFGSAHKCTFTNIPIAGYSKKKMKKYRSKPTPAYTIWFAPVVSALTHRKMFVPVKATGTMNWASVRVVITAGTLNGQPLTELQ